MDVEEAAAGVLPAAVAAQLEEASPRAVSHCESDSSAPDQIFRQKMAPSVADAWDIQAADGCRRKVELGGAKHRRCPLKAGDCHCSHHGVWVPIAGHHWQLQGPMQPDQEAKLRRTCSIMQRQLRQQRHR